MTDYLPPLLDGNVVRAGKPPGSVTTLSLIPGVEFHYREQTRCATRTPFKGNTDSRQPPAVSNFRVHLACREQRL